MFVCTDGMHVKVCSVFPYLGLWSCHFISACVHVLHNVRMQWVSLWDASFCSFSHSVLMGISLHCSDTLSI